MAQSVGDLLKTSVKQVQKGNQFYHALMQGDGLSSYENVNGLKYSGQRMGDFSAYDTQFVQEQRDAHKKRSGKGAVLKQYLDPETRTPLKNAIVEIEGRMYHTDHEGLIYIADEKWIQEDYEITREREMYFKSIADKIKTEQSLSVLLGLPIVQVRELCKKGGLVRAGLISEGLEDIDDVNCNPLIMNNYAPNSEQESTAMAKLLYIIKLFSPAVTKRKEQKRDIEESERATQQQIDAYMAQTISPITAPTTQQQPQATPVPSS